MSHGYRFIFPSPPYYAYIPGAVAPPVPCDKRPATVCAAYPKTVPIPVNPPPPQVIHVDDVNPCTPVFVSPYPPSTHKFVPEPKVVHVEDQPGARVPRRR